MEFTDNCIVDVSFIQLFEDVVMHCIVEMVVFQGSWVTIRGQDQLGRESSFIITHLISLNLISTKNILHHNLWWQKC